LTQFQKFFLKSLDAPAFSLPRHNLSRQLPSELPADLFNACLVWAWRGSMVPPLHPVYKGAYAVLCWGPLLIRQRKEIIALSCLKACTYVDTTLGSLRRRGRPPGPGATAMPATTRPGSPAACKRVSFSDPLVSSPSQQEQLRIHPGTVFLLPVGRFLHTPGRQLLRSLHKVRIHTASGNRL
jgi:hypothetical protein